MVLIGTKVDSDSRDCEHAASVKWAKEEKGMELIKSELSLYFYILQGECKFSSK